MAIKILDFGVKKHSYEKEMLLSFQLIIKVSKLCKLFKALELIA